jgi:predicted glycogen debranching enzyme
VTDGAACRAGGGWAAPSETNEWLEADGLGGFASGTTLGINTRRYHGLLVSALVPPAGRHVFVNDLLIWLEGPSGSVSLSSHRHMPGGTVLADVPPSACRHEPWPLFVREVFGVELRQEVTLLHGLPIVLVSFRLERPLPGHQLCLRPLLTGRGFHALHRENPACRLEASVSGALVAFHTYASLPAVLALSSGRFSADPGWYRNVSYTRELERGLDHLEDLASPGLFRFDLAEPRADLLLAQGSPEAQAWLTGLGAEEAADELRRRESARRAAFAEPLERAADAYIVQRGAGKTIIAGYPWFGDWGRDTFIALRGLCLATGRFDDARQILLAWSEAVSEGMLPNRFADDPHEPAEYNSVDAALWYIIAAAELCERDPALPSRDRQRLERAIEQIVQGHVRGTRHGIGVDAAGLLAAGAPGLQLTWMDAKVGDHVITPRTGKPVEIQALWLNALWYLARLGKDVGDLLARGQRSFAARFDPGVAGLYDVVDVGHRPGEVDASVRPNQVFAVGGLPLALLSPQRCREVLDVVERLLWTPIGLRSLAPNERGYVPHYAGGVLERDSAYHQGTVWPWLLGPFIEAWVKSRGGNAAARVEAHTRFVLPWRQHLGQAGLGHVSEVADAAAPHTPAGCPFQAWSVAELLRVERDVIGRAELQGGPGGVYIEPGGTALEPA